MPSDFAAYIYHRLSTDSTILGLVGQRIYNTVVPTGVSYPVVVFVLNSYLDMRGSGERWGGRALYLIKGIIPSPSLTTSMRQLANRIDELFEATVSDHGGHTYASWRDAPVDITEPVGTEVWRHIGGLYWILGY